MYKCNNCGKDFFFEGQLKRHVLFNHPQAEQPSSLFTEIERQVSSVIDDAPIASRRNRPTVHYNSELGGYPGYPNYLILESLREESSNREDLSREWSGYPPPVEPQWVANPVSW